MVRLRADLSRWLQRHALTATDLHEPRVDAWLQDRDQRCHPHRHDRPVLRRLRGQLRAQGVMPVPAVETTPRACDRLACDVPHSWLHPRGLAPTTVRDSLATVRRVLGERGGSEPLRLEARCPQDVTTCLWQQARRERPAHATWLAVTGMRISARVALDHDDVDRGDGLLTLRHTTCGQSRCLPLHPTTRQALWGSGHRRDRVSPIPNSPSCFVSEQGTRGTHGTVRATCVHLSRQIGLRAPTASHGPRLHDLRHRFAGQTLVRWSREGVAVARHLPELSTDLGHVKVSDPSG